MRSVRPRKFITDTTELRSYLGFNGLCASRKREMSSLVAIRIYPGGVENFFINCKYHPLGFKKKFQNKPRGCSLSELRSALSEDREFKLTLVKVQRSMHAWL